MTQEEYYVRMLAAVEALATLLTPKAEEPKPEPEEPIERKIMDKLNYEMAMKTAVRILGESEVSKIENEITALTPTKEPSK